MNLRHRINIQTNTQSLTTGVLSDSWSDYAAAVPASIRQLSASERDRAGAMHADASWEITIRWRPGIGSENRIQWVRTVFGIETTRLFDVLEVVEDFDNDRRWLRMLCREGRSQGS